MFRSVLFSPNLVVYLIRCDPNILLATLCSRSIQTHEGSIIKALDCAAATASRDALAKTVYARLFDWHVPIPSGIQSPLRICRAP